MNIYTCLGVLAPTQIRVLNTMYLLKHTVTTQIRVPNAKLGLLEILRDGGMTLSFCFSL